MDPSLQYLVIRAHLFSTLFMTGAVWFVQVVHYPFFRHLRAEDGPQASRFHRKRTGWILGPVMILELVTAVMLLSSSWVTQYGNYLWLNLGLLLVIWAVTFLKFVPIHHLLTEAYNPGAVNALVRLNWVRTILWSFRSILLLSFLG